jgi:hypothetical protein
MQEQFDVSGLAEAIGPEHFYPTVHAAVQALARSVGTQA